MSLKKGRVAEEKVGIFLVENGYEIVEKNFYSRFGEVDIIAKKDGVINFFEVKFSEKYDPVHRITLAKMKKIIKTVNYYFMLNDSEEEYQINAALVTPDGIEIIENIGF